MKKTMTGPERPTLSLPFGRTPIPMAFDGPQAGRTVRKSVATPGTLPPHELRRMVLEMLD